MALYITLGSIFLLCVIIALIRIYVIVEYGERGFIVTLKILGFKIILPPETEGKPKKTKKAKKPKKPKKEKPDEAPGNLEVFLSLMPDIKKLLARFFKRTLSMKLLKIELTAASDNPASAAMMFGGANAALGIIVPFMDNNFNIKERDITVGFDFNLRAPVIYVRAEIAVAVGSLIAIGVTFAVKYLITISKIKRKIKKQEA